MRFILPNTIGSTTNDTLLTACPQQAFIDPGSCSRGNTMRRLARILLMIIAATGAATAQNRIDFVRPDAPELAAYGEHAVGVRTLQVVNPGQIDVAKIDPKAAKPDSLPRYDRPLTVEIWYPAAADANGSKALKTVIRDGKTEVTLEGRAARDAAPAVTVKSAPLVVISHGFPGNRYLLSPLAENIASKGYVVASIEHTDSAYQAVGPFGSTLVNRPLDQKFVIGEMARLSRDPQSFLNGLVDANNTAVVGYSMGGYGAVVLAGGGLSQKAVDAEPPLGAPHKLLATHRGGSDTHNALFDPRVKVVVAFAPWGMTRGFFDSDTLKGVKVPILFIAGSVDDVSGYETGVKAIWKATTSVERTLLTFENANHNAGAPMPAPREAYKMDQALGFNLADHYTDAVWDNVRMNNVAAHFVTAWLGKHLKADQSSDAFLQLVPEANSGTWSVEPNGSRKPDHTYWKGFRNRTAKGLRFEVLKRGE
jgi:predicted dienelactone hydrolase